MAQIVAFGEIMLRFSPPGRELLLQTPQLQAWVAGAEANVVTALARLGHDTAMISAVPDNALGDAAVTTLRGHGVDCSRILRRPGRMGLYFVANGAGLRATQATYDRAGSTFACTPPDTWDWPALLAGAGRLHLSGITPALGDGPAQAALAAATAAVALGVPVSFDGNYRAQLWEARGGDPAAILRPLVDLASLMFGDVRDIALLLGRTFTDPRSAALAAFAAFPRLEMIASTRRDVQDADTNVLSARIDTREREIQTAPLRLANIVDRIGAGDAFAAGVLHALTLGGSAEKAAEIGLGLAALKHSLPGDASLVTRADLDCLALLGSDIRR